ncbi:MAG: DNA gyrase subunit A [Bacillus subtilis]|nr:DNA gyrase subunit A [Bacillus subtilis]
MATTAPSTATPPPRCATPKRGCRLFAEALLQDIDKRTVAFVPNFDDEEYEPVVLPAKYPNLLVNGSMGMATGYATNIPPHNFNEVIEATIYRIDHPRSTVAELMRYIKGPDFPTGAIVEGVDGILQAFETGKGRIVMKSKVAVSDTQLVVTEIPYEVNKADLVRKIDDIRLKKKIDGIVEVRDESDREGLRIVIDVLKEISSEGILAYLMKNTDLSLSFSYNVVAIQQKSPKLLALTEVLDAYINHQKEVVRNRSNFELQKAEKRRHIVEGFLKMVDILDEVIAEIRKSTGKKSAIDNLMKRFSFTEVQADAIVSLQLYRLSSTDVEEMRKEALDLSRFINLLLKILKNENELEAVIKKELQEINQKFPTPRKSVISETVAKVVLDEQELVQHETVMVALTKNGYLKRASIKSYQATMADAGLKDGDQMIRLQELSTRQTLLVFTTLGNYLTIPVYKIPEKKWKEVGEYIGTFAPILDAEEILDWLVIDDFNASQNILLTTREGLIKHVPLDQFVNQRLNKTYCAIPATPINPLVSIDLMQAYDTDIVVATKTGYLLKYSLVELPTLGIQARGVKAIHLRDDFVVGAVYTSSHQQRRSHPRHQPRRDQARIHRCLRKRSSTRQRQNVFEERQNQSLRIYQSSFDQRIPIERSTDIPAVVRKKCHHHPRRRIETRQVRIRHSRRRQRHRSNSFGRRRSFPAQNHALLKNSFPQSTSPRPRNRPKKRPGRRRRCGRHDARA